MRPISAITTAAGTQTIAVPKPGMPESIAVTVPLHRYPLPLSYMVPIVKTRKSAKSMTSISS